jgi:hypothetical protein
MDYSATAGRFHRLEDPVDSVSYIAMLLFPGRRRRAVVCLQIAEDVLHSSEDVREHGSLFIDRLVMPKHRDEHPAPAFQLDYLAFSFLVAVPDMMYAPPAKSISAVVLPSGAGVNLTAASTAFPS